MTTYNFVKDNATQVLIQLLYTWTFESWYNDHNIENKEPFNFIKKTKKLNVIGKLIIGNSPKLAKDTEKKEIMTTYSRV